jgi:hypothetical protein
MGAMPIKRRWTDDELRAAVATSKTWRAVQQKLGLRGKGGTHYDVISRARALLLDISHFTTRRERLWTDEQLRVAVAGATNYPTLMTSLGVDMSGGNERAVRRRIFELGIDATHFTRRRGPSREVTTSWSDDQLRAAVAESKSVAQVIRKLGLIPAGGNYNQVGRRLDALKLDTAHFTGKRWNLGGNFVSIPALPLEELLVANRPTQSHKLKLRLFRAGLKKPACELCGWAERALDGRIPVELDHANGDKNDNRLENLRILCPNCHALQPTHRGLNQKLRKKD